MVAVLDTSGKVVKQPVFWAGLAVALAAPRQARCRPAAVRGAVAYGSRSHLVSDVLGGDVVGVLVALALAGSGRRTSMTRSLRTALSGLIAKSKLCQMQVVSRRETEADPGMAARADLGAALAEYGRTHDPGLRESLVAAHLGLAHWAAARFTGRGEPLDDLVQVALVGLLKALDRFDPDRGSSFSGYAVATMLGELKRHLRDRAWAIRPPRGLHDRYLRVRRAVEELTQEHGRAPAVADIAARTAMTVDEVVEATEVGCAWTQDSLDERLDAGDGRGPAGTDDRLAAVEERADLAPLLGRLSPRARRVVHLRFVDDLTQTEIARQLGVSQMQVSRILSQSLARLRATSAP
ncbi:MAG: sigma-70 family RNA polymerase sigma factor [Actinobacteria bacterium]|nr:sigma-70 family RNA polymerase sigma factor [Actinomycetota bacterium]